MHKVCFIQKLSWIKKKKNAKVEERDADIYFCVHPLKQKGETGSESCIKSGLLAVGKLNTSTDVMSRTDVFVTPLSSSWLLLT